ncbi:MAG: ferrous iron transport protein A [candidate division Zixibacteria bacterium]|nr:ferrous iron transport protein A [candidate division Zixibacteria bacterium]MCI0595696.1 ferrous iron transport protein A [candidate division Zixibacteria bacterium]
MFAFLFPAAKPETTVRIKSLADLEAGESGRVIEVAAKEPLALHILEIGLVSGAKVRHLRSAPLGDPIQVEVDGFLLSLRRNEAEAVIVEIQE